MLYTGKISRARMQQVFKKRTRSVLPWVFIFDSHCLFSLFPLPICSPEFLCSLFCMMKYFHPEFGSTLSKPTSMKNLPFSQFQLHLRRKYIVVNMIIEVRLSSEAWLLETHPWGGVGNSWTEGLNRKASSWRSTCNHSSGCKSFPRCP